ncbi:MAG: protein-L-isoaspartate(D-aspartate) O-methyltransferase [Sulfuricellaceae bacterium]|jgi:protein-L-isoaspartate(D-aspartate) O-methyltransferase
MHPDTERLLADIAEETRQTRFLTGIGELDSRVMAAMAEIPRHAFVPQELHSRAYDNGPLPIGHGQTISQPFIVALMTALLQPEADHRVLEVGAGSGYQAAVLSRLVARVYTVEIVEPLASAAAERLKTLGYGNVEVRCGDGYRGWPELAPFDGILVAAAAPHVPQPLVDQLKPGGKLVIPVGQPYSAQELLLIDKLDSGELRRRSVLPVAFVPLTGSLGH